MVQLALLLNVPSISVTPTREPIYDPYWDEIENNTEPGFIVLEPSSLCPVPEQDIVSYDARILRNLDSSVLEPVKTNAVPELFTQWVETYSPSNRKKNLYYRYCWKCKGKIKHRHIPGGNIQSPIPNARKEIIEQSIKSDISPTEIETLINIWSEK